MKDGLQFYCRACSSERTRKSRTRRFGPPKGGLCAICREAPAAHVDHDHETGRVRGLLCFNCNGALGRFRDRRDLMLAAIAYLDADGFSPLADRPVFGFSLFHGDSTSPRPDGELRIA
jgi:hypothetical protein